MELQKAQNKTRFKQISHFSLWDGVMGEVEQRVVGVLRHSSSAYQSRHSSDAQPQAKSSAATDFA
jgi:hypothetical protein